MPKTHRRRWRIRETPPSERFPQGVPEEWVELDYTKEEFALAAELAEKGSVSEVDTLHELKALLGARLIPDEDGAETRMAVPEASEQLSLG
jgi:hypothetical protein